MVFRCLVCHRKGAVLGKCSFSMNVFQVNTEFITTTYSQPMYLVQTEPELTVQIAKTEKEKKTGGNWGEGEAAEKGRKRNA